MSTTLHTIKQFDVELEAVRAKVLEMGGLVEEQIEKAVEALHEADLALADHVIAEDHHVNALEVSIDENCTFIIARRQPAASDLRLIIAIIKTITDLERMGDEAEKIARMAKMIHTSERLMHTRPVDLRHVAQLAVDMLRRALDSFARLDTNTAMQILRDDLDVDESFRGILRQLITFMMEDPRTISNSIELLFAAKAIERIGDHAKNIAEYVIFLVKGKDVRHTSVEEIEKEVVAPLF
ncbi:phosphate signaling complex protein PhoU [Ferrovum sp. PN-J185]|jgi:phosphate transport system protein|uniref:phosphate signaling complex protein PhoU n=1 Tax=Ferrovum sp. PN-J185 TaxID=1356306 RepID=UPI00079801CF|nr:phosphate signaling complex protein PhoU [Ferrovum sp. PN-J185]MDE1891844.1 phosphate signaling complex protein PhoU [Betaproteobacteria bacterium]OZB33038.1 MAG: phosphate transport system regulatory protein PhoU [Ferrovum sp. 34-44-207]HQT82471.1 phosphate signaling complex protein PhoU [Ferrovaceae bacterium]KXW55860.1 phosphate-specific transport system accessory protein PhoU [Ferrovum sp. PN-J185]MCC6068751.1 phosphate signaling complex protein PhoU [Ferrovum sp. PN-J185]